MDIFAGHLSLVVAHVSGVVMSKCENCGERPGTRKWLGEGGAVDLVHGFYSMWCEVCVLKEQIKHAEERAAALPEMRARLFKLAGCGDE
jgi:hypothetical protein